MSKFSIKDILSGDVLSHGWFNQKYKVILLISGLIFLYIYSGYQSQRQQRILSDLQKELQDVQLTQLTLNTELMNKSRQSSVARMLKEKGSAIKETNKPATRIQ